MPTDSLKEIIQLWSKLGWGDYLNIFNSDGEPLHEVTDEAPALPDGAIECEYEIIEEGETHELLHD